MENNKTIVFCCEGNPYCQKCHGNGTYEIENRVEIIKTFVSQKDIEKEKEELERYLHGEKEKLFASNWIFKKKKKKSKFPNHRSKW